LVKKWLPAEKVTEQTMGEAVYLEQTYWDNMSNAIADGIAKVL